MELNDDFLDFITCHAGDDIHKLLLARNKKYNFDYQLAVDQIEARKKIKTKLPLWYENPRLLFPSLVSAEQASSAITAAYKQHLLRGNTLCDLTGGLGVDTYYFSLVAKEVTYVERFAAYSDIAKHNFEVLEARNIRVVNADSREFVQLPDSCFSTFFIDPARRGEENKRLFALQDCEPDVVGLLPLLLSKAQRVVIKASPMIDIWQSLAELLPVTEVHIVSVRNECKELLFVADRETTGNPATIVCVNFNTESTEHFSFTREEETASNPTHAESLKQYLYEPNASVLKGGAFKSVAMRLELEKLHPSSHLYTADKLVSDFPGRKFEITEVLDFSGKTLKSLNQKYPKANITTRNFPLAVEEIRKRSKVKEGGDCYLFATTLQPERRVLVACRKVD